MFTQIDHLGVATRDIAGAIAILEKAGPCLVGAREIVARYKLEAVMVAAPGAPIELIMPTADDSTIAAYLDKRGEGLHHVAYRVANIEAALETCRAAGFKLIDETPRTGYAGSRVAFVHPKSMLGVLTELVQREAGHDAAPYELPHESRGEDPLKIFETPDHADPKNQIT